MSKLSEQDVLEAVNADSEQLLYPTDASYGSVSKLPVTIETAEEYLTRSQLLMISAAIYLGIFLAAVDTTVVNTVSTIIASDLGALSSISWISTAYLLSCSAFQPLWGKLSDIFGRKPLLVICCGFFAMGCTICAMKSLEMLIVGRFVTGLGGSGLISLGSITFSDIIPLRDRGLYQGFGNIAFGMGAASGGVLGGLVADTMGWRYVFVLQIPLAVLVGLSIVIFLRLPDGSPGMGSTDQEFMSKFKRIDFVGSFLLVLALTSILIAASLGGREIAYDSKTFIILVIASLGLLVSFAKWENDFASEPTLPVRLLANKAILATCLTTWFYTMSVFAYLFYIPVYFTSVLDFTATENGSRLIPNFFAVAIGSLGSGYYMKRTGRYYKLQLVVNIIAIIGVFRISRISPQTSVLSQYTLLLPCGFAYAWTLTVALLSLIAAVPIEFQASTTSIQYTFRATGSTLGVSIASAIFQNVLTSNLHLKIYELVADKKLADSIIERALESAKDLDNVSDIIQKAIKTSYAAGCKGAFIFSCATMVLGCLSSIFIKEHVLHRNLERD